jgi:sulfatase maturation enzyme AslB (radical SAM superfamily)
MNSMIKDAAMYFVNKVESSKWPKRPRALNIEMTSICDAKCIHCPRAEMDRKMEPMNWELFTKIIDQAAELKIPNICPNGYGETLTMKDMEKYLAYIRSKKHRFHININTNGNRMTQEKRDIFIKYDVDLLNICLDGATHETMAKVRPKLDPAKIEENIHALIKEKKEKGSKHPKIRLGYVPIPENVHETDAFMKKWEGIPDYLGIDGFSNRAEDDEIARAVAATMPEPTSKPSACSLPFDTMNVWTNGEVVLCCNDWNSKNVCGNMNSSDLKDIWLGEEFSKVRKAHMNGCGSDIEICKQCNWWQKPNKGVKLWDTEIKQ